MKIIIDITDPPSLNCNDYNKLSALVQKILENQVAIYFLEIVALSIEPFSYYYNCLNQILNLSVLGRV